MDRHHLRHLRLIWQILSAALGVWLMAAPAVLGHAGSSLGDLDRVVGPTVAAVSFVAAAQITRSLRWLNVPAAAALLIAPWSSTRRWRARSAAP